MPILGCTCRNEYQDSKYGKGLRLFNPSGKYEKARCTVCGREATFSTKKAKEVAAVAAKATKTTSTTKTSKRSKD